MPTAIPLPEDVRQVLDRSFFMRTTTKGRRSGRPYTFETTYTWDGDRRLYLSGYPGPRDWVANIAHDAAVVLHTVEGGTWYDLPGRGRVLRDRDERLPHMLAFIARWAARAAGPRPLFALVLRAIGLNRAFHLPWWGPFYVVRRILDAMPCVEIEIVGPATAREGGPPPLSNVLLR
jgi:hypothetical protein